MGSITSNSSCMDSHDIDDVKYDPIDTNDKKHSPSPPNTCLESKSSEESKSDSLGQTNIDNLVKKVQCLFNKGDDDDCKQECIDITKYAVNYEHVHIPIIEFSDSTETSDEHSATKLLKIYDAMSISSDDIKLWTAISSTQNGRSMLSSVATYSETNTNASDGIKSKLRVVTKLLMGYQAVSLQKLNEYKNIVLLLASHGHVCHVLKEVAINNAYGMMTNNLEQYIKSQSLQQQILRALYTLRVLLVEKLHHAFKFSNNVHYIAS